MGQRLTALNIGLRGSFADRTPRAWRHKAWSYPIRRLYLSVLKQAAENEDGRLYDFRFALRHPARLVRWQSRDSLLLRRVTHWTDEDVAREKELSAQPSFRPTITLQEGFAELLPIFGLERVSA